MVAIRPRPLLGVVLRRVRGPIALHRSVDMRYGEQVFEINVPLDGIDWSADPLAQIVDRFHRRHEELYTYAQRDQEAVLVNDPPA